MRIIQRMAAAAALVFAVSAQAGAGPTDATPQAVLQAPVVYALTAAQDPPPVQTDVKTTVTKTTTWYADPVWVTVAILAAALIIGLIVVGSRNSGGQTTVIK